MTALHWIYLARPIGQFTVLPPRRGSSCRQVRLGNDCLDAKRGARVEPRRSASCLPIPFGCESAAESTERTCSVDGGETTTRERERERERRKGGVCWSEFPRAGPPRRRPPAGTEACRIRVPCICNEGCAPPTRRATVAVSLRIVHKTSVDYRRGRAKRAEPSRAFYALGTYPARSIEMQSLARMIYTSSMPARGAGCRTSLLYVSIVRLRKYPAAPKRVTLDTYVPARSAPPFAFPIESERSAVHSIDTAYITYLSARFSSS